MGREVHTDTPSVGQQVTVWGLTSDGYEGWGQGGKIVAVDGQVITLRTPVNTVEYDMADKVKFPYGASVTFEEALDASECLNYGDDCQGTVDYRTPLSGTGKSFPRCDGHWSERLDRQAEIDRRYPDSPFPPADFDPAYAGESWGDDG